jgi:hypothetical protein
MAAYFRLPSALETRGVWHADPVSRTCAALPAAQPSPSSVLELAVQAYSTAFAVPTAPVRYLASVSPVRGLVR